LIDTNYLLNPNNNPNVALAYAPFSTQELQPLVVDLSSGVSVGANIVDKVSRRAFVTDANFRELAAYAPGSTVRLSAYNLGTLAGAAASLTDADGRGWPLTIGATSTHGFEVALPVNVGLGGAFIAVKSGATQFFGTLFIDNQNNIAAINQATYLVSPNTTTVPATAGSVAFLVVTPAGNSHTLTSSDSFVTVGAGGTGTTVVTASLAANS